MTEKSCWYLKNKSLLVIIPTGSCNTGKTNWIYTILIVYVQSSCRSMTCTAQAMQGSNE